MATTENVHFRTTPEIKQRILEAAALLGLSMTDFIESAAAERAQQILGREPVVLNAAERDRFLAAISNSAEPPAAMVEGANRVMKGVREGVLGD